MIIIPNIPTVIETEKAHAITKYIASKISDSVEFIEARDWKSNVAASPEFVTIDSDRDIHMFYVIVSHIDPDDEIEEISECFIEKKVCKKLTKEFIEVFNDELDDGSCVYIEVMFLIVHGETLDNGTCRGCTVYSRKVKSKE